MDETTDSAGRYIAHLLIGVLNQQSCSKAHLIACKQLEKTNALTVTRLVQEELAKFFLPDPIPCEKFLLFLSDAAPYMVKAGQNIKIFYSELIHVTFLAHGVKKIAEEFKKSFPLINELSFNIKKFFSKHL